MKKNINHGFVLIGLILVCLTASFVLNFTKQNAIEDTLVRNKNLSDGSVNVVPILDVKGVMRMTAVHYLPNEFAELGEVMSDVAEEDLPAKRRTYRFYIDPLTIEEWAESESLNHLLKPDGNWHLTM